jgi:hypothetical protein
MPNTTNFNWTTPADTDLVKDGALAIRTLANGIDTSFLDLKGGTTGQALKKNSNTDLDFVWGGVNPTTASATVATSESTTSTSFTDLTTAGPAVTLTTGTSALVIVGTQVYQNTADRGAYMGFAVSGATTIAASEAQAVGIFNGTATPAPKISAAFVVTLTSGSNTFTAKYKRSGASGTAVFNDRNIFVMNLA